MKLLRSEMVLMRKKIKLIAVVPFEEQVPNGLNMKDLVPIINLFNNLGGA